MNVHEDVIAQPLGFCMQSGFCLVIPSSGIALSTRWGLENKEPSSQAETWGVLSRRPPDIGDT